MFKYFMVGSNLMLLGLNIYTLKPSNIKLLFTLMLLGLNIYTLKQTIINEAGNIFTHEELHNLEKNLKNMEDRINNKLDVNHSYYKNKLEKY
jgi:hypothetical protein